MKLKLCSRKSLRGLYRVTRESEVWPSGSCSYQWLEKSYCFVVRFLPCSGGRRHGGLLQRDASPVSRWPDQKSDREPDEILSSADAPLFGQSLKTTLPTESSSEQNKQIFSPNSSCRPVWQHFSFLDSPFSAPIPFGIVFVVEPLFRFVSGEYFGESRGFDLLQKLDHAL